MVGSKVMNAKNVKKNNTKHKFVKGMVTELEFQVSHSLRFFLYANVEINYDRYFENVICWFS